jgi:REP element-mobilizing transposase RayT
MAGTIYGNETPGYRALRKGRQSEINFAFFLTTRVAEREPLLIGGSAEIALKCLFTLQRVCRFPLLAFVLMPEHVHVLGILTEAVTINKIFGRWKAWVAKELNELAGKNGRFWQAGFYDHAIRNDENLEDIARYIELNPVRRNLIEKPEMYPYSSAFHNNRLLLLGQRWLCGEDVYNKDVRG